MTESKKTLHEALRAGYMDRIKAFLESEGEEVLVTGSNEFALPCVDSAGNDEFMVLVFKVPTGSRDGEPYDGYGMAEDFRIKSEAKAAKAKELAKAKAEKIAKDKAQREAKAKAKAEHEAAKEKEKEERA